MSVKIWLDRIGRAEQLQSKHEELRKFIIKMYKNESLTNNILGETEKSEVPFLYAYTKVKYAALYARNPYIFSRARSYKYVPFAETMEQVLNYYWDYLRIKQKSKLVVNDAVLQAPGWMKIGYTAIVKRVPKMQQEINALLELPSGEKKSLEEKGIYDETIKNEDVFCNYVPCGNILWPDGYNNIRECPYIIEWQKIPLIDLQRNTMFKNTDMIRQGTRREGSGGKIQNYTMNAIMPLTSGGTDIDDEVYPVTVFHVWDKRERKRYSVCRELPNDYLLERDWDDLSSGFLHYPLIFNPVPQTSEDANSYPLSDVVPMIPALRDLSRLNAAMIRHANRAGSLIITREGTLSPEQITQIQKSGNLEVVQLKSLSENDLQTFTTPAMPADWYRIRQLIIEDLMRTSGFIQLLSASKGVETATESENLRAGEMLTQSEAMDVVETYNAEIAKGLAALIWQYIPRQRIAEITGEDNLTDDLWPALPEDRDEAFDIINNQIQIKIEAGSMRPPKDKAVDRKQWMDLAFGIQAAFPGRVKADVFIQQLLKQFDFKDLNRVVIAHDEEEIAAAQQENELLAQNIPQVVTPNENHELHIKVHSQGQPSEEMDRHIDSHASFMEGQSAKANPQRGDTTIAPVTTQPDLRRSGVPEGGDIAGGAMSMREPGANNGP